MTPSVGGIVLAGGLSSRMGREKGLVPFCGKPMIAWVLAALHPLVSDLVVVANDPAYAAFGYRVVADDFKEMGPVGGLCTGLRNVRTEVNIVLACDMPCITTDLLQHLLDQLGDAPAIAAQTAQRKQPLVGIYRRECLPAVVENLSVGRLRMDLALTAAGGSFYTFPGSMQGFDATSLRNFNTPEDIADYDCRQGRG
jgi:molybdopterin-guanine dinucleotide biosynthesis protein A